jgi:hypothetical protein
MTKSACASGIRNIRVYGQEKLALHRRS